MKKVLAAAFAVFAIVVAAPAQAAPAAQEVVLVTTLTSVGTSLNTIGNVKYGWNDLKGVANWGKEPVSIRLQGDVAYKNDSGPFNGYYTITRADGAQLAFHVDGQALAIPVAAGTKTKFHGVMSFLQGSGAYSNAQSTGTMVGAREAAIGSPVQMTLRFTIVPRG
ncbi:MAG: hypothetical protein PHN51_06265 [Candidatus Nanopelagicales bacterium]|nr:hypothetical protein [Candidatus Nanopelagicales bacterium]